MTQAWSAGNARSQIRAALSTLGAQVDGQKDDTDFASDAVYELVSRIVEQGGSRTAELLSSNKKVYMTAIFLMTAADHYSRVLNARFEDVGMVAQAGLMPMKLVMSDAKFSHTLFVNFSIDNPQAIMAIGQGIAEWTNAPTPDNFEKLVKMFAVFASAVKD